MWVRRHKVILIVIAVIMTACEPKPQPVELGSDQCSYCRMMITDREFASQVLNNQGRSFKFDSVECMAAYDLSADETTEFHSLWVPDFKDPETWLPSEEAIYLKSKTLRSPMGLNLTAYSTRESAEEMKQEYGGEIVSYAEVKELVKREWLNGSGNNHGSHNHH
ncbi:MAG: nitrous oxide reductase accessory protein NosL [Balneolaceae bacterium]|nr:nitrous oxide reductase accessory protein NosL [Balneolaceae bacterium]MCH8547853.1 nitrous oxide reductase accessory protein NosL [Balneolaceae bacterium]